MKNIILFSFILSWTCLAAQQVRYQPTGRNNEGNVLLANFLFGGNLPGADMADRFGPGSSVGGSLDFFTKNNFIIGLQSNFIFGPKVNQDVLTNLRDDEGLIFGDDGGIAELRLRQRGLYIGGHVGMIIPFAGPNRRSGIRVTAGGGFFQHKIRIQDDPQVFVPILSGAYKKGYDRLSNGFALTEFIGYQVLSNNRRINFLAGVELTQGFTQSRRSFNFDTRLPEKDKRLDLLYGFRIGWTLPFYIGENPDEIRY